MKLPVPLTTGISNDSITFESSKNALLLEVDKARALADIGPLVLRISFLSLGVKAQPHTWAQALFRDQTRFLPSTLLLRLVDSLYFESADCRKITGKTSAQEIKSPTFLRAKAVSILRFNLLKCLQQSIYIPFCFCCPQQRTSSSQQQQQQQNQQQQQQQVALHLKQQQMEEAVNLVSSIPWVLLPHQQAQQQRQQQEQQQHQQQQHPWMYLVSLLCLESEWEELGLPPHNRSPATLLGRLFVFVPLHLPFKHRINTASPGFMPYLLASKCKSEQKNTSLRMGRWEA
ncbi:hypothetical protein Efla_007274 [Eimeria flavescens]